MQWELAEIGSPIRNECHPVAGSNQVLIRSRPQVRTFTRVFQIQFDLTLLFLEIKRQNLPSAVHGPSKSPLPFRRHLQPTNHSFSPLLNATPTLRSVLPVPATLESVPNGSRTSLKINDMYQLHGINSSDIAMFGRPLGLSVRKVE